MRKQLLFYLCVFVFSNVKGQNIGIGSTSFVPTSDVLLELRSTTGGFLLPRMTNAQKFAIPSPAEGLMIYQTDYNNGIKYFDGVNWGDVEGTGDTLGNHLLLENWIGDDFRISNDADNEGLYVSTTGSVGIGTGSANATLDINGSFGIIGLADTDTQIVVTDANGYLKTRPLDQGIVSVSVTGIEYDTTSNSTFMPMTNMELELDSGDYILQFNCELRTIDDAITAEFAFFDDNTKVSFTEKSIDSGSFDALSSRSVNIMSVVRFDLPTIAKVKFRKTDKPGIVEIRRKHFWALKLEDSL